MEFASVSAPEQLAQNERHYLIPYRGDDAQLFLRFLPAERESGSDVSKVPLSQ